MLNRFKELNMDKDDNGESLFNQPRFGFPGFFREGWEKGLLIPPPPPSVSMEKP